MIPQDKVKHFIVGAIASIVVYVVTFNATIAISFAVLLGIAKEAYDAQGHGTVEVLDAVATALGGVVGTVIIKAVITWTSV